MSASLGACCFSGYVKTHLNARGEMRKIGGDSCYITPANGQSPNVILLVPDVFGVYPNSKLYADRLNEETGSTVVVVDFFNGPGVPLSTMALMARAMPSKGFWHDRSFFGGLWNMISSLASFLLFATPSFLLFMWRHGRNLEPKHVVVENLLSGLVVERGMRQFVAAGYCYGTPFVTRLGASSKWQNIIKGISPTHGKLPAEDIANLKVQGHFACAEKDFALSDKQREELIAKLKNHPNAAARESDVKLYRGRHGFAMRADPLVSPELEQAVEECFQDMVSFSKRVMQLQ